MIEYTSFDCFRVFKIGLSNLSRFYEAHHSPFSSYTESELLEQWWAPKPWRAETKSMNFAVGGFWLYAMVGPDNSTHWGRANYLSINPMVNFEVEDAFCDEEENMNAELPITKWNIIFA